MEDPAEILYADDRKRRVVIFRGSNGTYSYREECYYKNDLAGTGGWASLGGRACYYDDLKTAKREVTENVTWLAKRRNS